MFLGLRHHTRSDLIRTATVTAAAAAAAGRPPQLWFMRETVS